MPKVSVIIPTYNCARYLSEALHSVLSQTYQDFEIIIIDDGSTDNTGDLIKVYIKTYPGKIRYLHQENKGQAVARNLGITESRGEYIALLDADDMWLPTRLEEGVRILDDFTDIALVHSNVTRMSEDGKILDTPVRDKRFLSGHIFKHLLTQDAHVSSPTVLFRKECCRSSGLFDENLRRLGSEDRDLWFRITKDHKAKYISKVLAYYRMRPGSASRDRQKMLNGIIYVIDKYCPERGPNKRLRKCALARVYRDLGDEFLFDRDFRESRRQYLKSLRFKPFSLWPWLNLFKALSKVEIG